MIKLGKNKGQGSSADRMWPFTPLDVSGPLSKGKGEPGTPKHPEDDSHQRPITKKV